jgi:hypothetical protein
MFLGAYPLGGQPDGGFAFVQPPDTNFVADSGTIGLVGQEATLSADAAITADAGTLGLVGGAATIGAVADIVAEASTVGLLGDTTSFTADATVTADAGTLDLVGSNPWSRCLYHRRCRHIGAGW